VGYDPRPPSAAVRAERNIPTHSTYRQRKTRPAREAIQHWRFKAALRIASKMADAGTCIVVANRRATTEQRMLLQDSPTNSCLKYRRTNHGIAAPSARRIERNGAERGGNCSFTGAVESSNWPLVRNWLDVEKNLTASAGGSAVKICPIGHREGGRQRLAGGGLLLNPREKHEIQRNSCRTTPGGFAQPRCVCEPRRGFGVRGPNPSGGYRCGLKPRLIAGDPSGWFNGLCCISTY